MPLTANKEIAFKRSEKLMGNRFEITVVAEDEEWAHEKISLAVIEISRIEVMLTTFNEQSETNAVNRNAGIAPVKVSSEMFDLTQRSLKLSSLTQGAFDITYGGIDRSLWNFDTHMKSLPDAATAKKMVRLINYRNVILDENEHTIFLKEEGMRIGFGGIGKGYAADKAKQLLVQQGVQSGIVNASGDLVAWGNQPDGKPWTVGIAHPDLINQPFSFMEISGMAIATSGNYEKYAIINGKRYSHTIDPKTGLPVAGIKSVSIISTTAEIADAMATPVMVMGTRVGLNLLNQVNGIAGIIIDDDNNIFTTNNILLQ